jgi:hypothetical protein
MKRIIYLLVIIGTIFAGCNPLEDIYNDLDAVDNPIVGEDVYTLTSEDYDELELGFGSFSSEDDAKAMLPGFLTEKYPLWGNGSSVNVGYRLYIGNAEGVSDYSGADIYQLTNADYASTGSDAFGFYPLVDSNDYIPGVLDAAIAGPVEGQIILAKYKQYFNDPVVGLANVFEAAFPGDFGNFENIDVVGPGLGWTAGSSYVVGSGYDGSNNDNEDWLISPEIDLTGVSNLKFQINQMINFLNGQTQLINILVATDYTTGGDHTAATWNPITLAMAPDGTNWNYVLSEDYDFSAYDGQTIHIAFKYEATTSDAPNWRIESFTVKTLGVDGEANSKGTHYMYTEGEWEAVDDVYYLSSADFDSMGEESGQPGRYNNFGSTTPPDDYLPTFLSLTEPWAYGQEEDEVIMVYDYFSSSSGAQIRGNRYTVIDGMWVGHKSTIDTFLKFGHDGNMWVPDNTIRYNITSADVAFISNAFITIYPGPADNVGFFGSFDRRSSSSNYWSDAMLLEAFNALLENGNFVTAEEQKYVLTYVIYNGATTDETMSVIKTGGVWVLQE